MPCIVIIDDDEDLRPMLRRALEKSGFEALSAADGWEGLELIRTNPVDLVVTDLIMPEMEGIELILQLRQSHPGLKIIAMSGGGRMMPGNYLAAAKACGAVEILEKPFTLQEFLERVAALTGP